MVKNSRSVKTISRVNLRFLAWTGDRKEFDKLVSICRQIVDDARRRALAAIDRSPEARQRFIEVNEHAKTKTDKDRVWQHRVENLERDAAGSIRLSMRARHRKFEQEMSGDPSEVLEALEPSDIVKLGIGMGVPYSNSPAYNTSGYGLQLDFDVREGVNVSISGPESDWVILASEKLKSSLIVRRPWYWWLLKEMVVGPIVSGTFALTVGLSITPILINARDSILSAVFATLMLTVIGVTVGLGTAASIKKVLPSFELLEPGERAKGARVMGVVTAVVLWVVSSVAIPVLFWAAAPG